MPVWNSIIYERYRVLLDRRLEMSARIVPLRPLIEFLGREGGFDVPRDDARVLHNMLYYQSNYFLYADITCAASAYVLHIQSHRGTHPRGRAYMGTVRPGGDERGEVREISGSFGWTEVFSPKRGSVNSSITNFPGRVSDFRLQTPPYAHL